jgi:hypothetical protein
VPDYPKCTAADIQGKVVEHFLWNKVTTHTTFDLHGNLTAAQMDFNSQLLSSPPPPPNSALITQELHTALKESFVMLQTMMDEYIQIVKDRDEWWKAQLQRRQRQTLGREIAPRNHICLCS